MNFPHLYKMIALYTPFVSKLAHKKYSVFVLGPQGRRKLIHFGGDPRKYGHYFDALQHYSHLDTLDEGQRARYYARHGTSDDINTAKFWSNLILW
jgi:hypothetical protein